MAVTVLHSVILVFWNKTTFLFFAEPLTDVERSLL